MPARFDGPRIVELLSDGRRVRLVNPLAFYDPADTCWSVPADTIVDGASIPRVLWSLIGGPLEGPYRDASIIHDFYCDTKSRPWPATHRVFFDAMIASGVPEVEAKIMYFAVYWRGPRWTHDSNPDQSVPPKQPIPLPTQHAIISSFTDRIIKQDLSLEEIERAAT